MNILNEINDLTWLWSSLIGIVGTVIGTILGSILSRKKKKNIIVSVNNFYQYKLNNSERNSIVAKVECRFNVFIHNPSDYVKVIRDLKLTVINDKIDYYLTIKNLDDSIMPAGILLGFKEISIDNIYPNYSTLYNCVIYLNEEDINHIKKSTTFCISYIDEKNLENRTKISNPFKFDELTNLG